MIRPTHSYVPGEAIVRLKNAGAGLVPSDFAEDHKVLERFDRGPATRSDEGQLLRVKVGENMQAALEELSHDPRVAYAEPNYEYELVEPQDGGGPSQPPAEGRTPNDLTEAQWAFKNTGQDGGKPGADIGAERAWGVTTGSRTDGPLIAVIDTGIDYNHPDLKNNMWVNPGEIPGNGIDDDGNGVVDDVYGYNAIHDNGDPMDEHFHGTHVAGTIAAEGNNGQGVVGVNWQGRMMAVKIFDGTPKTTAAAILRGVQYATRMGARLTSNSWGGGAYNQSIYEAFRDSPALHIAGAGNSHTNNDNKPFYPSSYNLDNMIAVAATDRKDEMAFFSCYGAQTVDLAAPGHQILSTVPGEEQYHSYSGTSMATPHVSGVAGLILTDNPQATNAQVRDRLLLSTDPLPALQGKTVTGGRLNAAAAVERDALAPAAPEDLQVTIADPLGVTVAWKSTGDDGYCGQAAGYEVRYSDRPIALRPNDDQVAWDQASLLEAGRPAAPGNEQSARLWTEPQKGDRPIYFAVQAVDNVGNRSGLSSLSTIIPGTESAPPSNLG